MFGVAGSWTRCWGRNEAWPSVAWWDAASGQARNARQAWGLRGLRKKSLGGQAAIFSRLPFFIGG